MFVSTSRISLMMIVHNGDRYTRILGILGTELVSSLGSHENTGTLEGGDRRLHDPPCKRQVSEYQ
jgi:hypothetical protein